MARGLNRVSLIGNCGSDPETRFTPSGAQVTNVNIAVSESWTDKEGNRQEKTEWVPLVFWRKLAEIAGQYLKKGSKIYAEGKLQTRSWDGEDGQKRYKTEVIVFDMVMLDGRQGEGGGQGGGGGEDFGSPPPMGDDDLPF